MSDRLKKILVVIFLTLLVWAWAFMSLKEPLTRPGSLKVASASNSSLLVTFTLGENNPQTEIPLTSLNFTGTPSKISELKTQYALPLDDKNLERLDFYYDPAERTESTYTLNLLEYLQKSSKVQDLALTLESCTPPEVDVKIEELVEKELPIQCVDKDGLPVDGANPVPGVVKIFVRKAYNESATVVLSPQLMDLARKQPVEATAYVELGVAGVRRESQTPVKIELQSEERLKPHNFQPTSFRFVMSPEIASNYEVELVNETFTGTTNFMATDEAMDAYKKMQYHIRIEIRDGDELLSEIPPRPVIYNFPPDHFKNGDIDIVEVTVPKTATFKLIPLNPELN